MYQEVCFNRGTEAGGRGELMWANRSAPPQSFYACYGPVWCVSDYEKEVGKYIESPIALEERQKQKREARISSNAPWNHLQSLLFYCVLFEQHRCLKCLSFCPNLEREMPRFPSYNRN